MGHIPSDAEWYIAELVMEITVSGAAINIVHRDSMLIHAHSPNEAYDKALALGKIGETEYINPKDQQVQIRFRGISKLDVIYEPLEDGAELYFEEQRGVSEADMQKLIPPKEKLEVFTPPKPGREHDPDYRSKAVIEEAVRMIGEKT